MMSLVELDLDQFKKALEELGIVSEHPVAFDHAYFLGKENSLLKDQVTLLAKTTACLSLGIVLVSIVAIVLAVLLVFVV